MSFEQLMNEVRRGFGATFADALQKEIDEQVEDARYDGYADGRDAGYYDADDRYQEGYDDGYESARDEYDRD